MPPHRVYLEPYCGSAALLFAKPPAEVEIINDIDPGVTDVLRCLSDTTSRREFMRLARQTEHGRRLFRVCKREWTRPEELHIRAWMYWYVAVVSFGGSWGSCHGTDVQGTCGSRPKTVAKLRNTVLSLPAASRRMRNVIITNRDALEVIQECATDDCFTYIDPPYIGPERRKQGVYRYECDLQHHRRLVELLLDAPGAVILSCYDHPVYDRLRDAGWEQQTWQRACYAAGRTRETGLRGSGRVLSEQLRREMVLLNPECVSRLLRASSQTKVTSGRVSIPSTLLELAGRYNGDSQ